MQAFEHAAAKGNASESAARKAAPAPARTTKQASPLTLQRKAQCACGGGCPRCQKTALQPKLSISQPGDRHEQEADRMAEHVMRMPAPAAMSGTHGGLPSSHAAETVQRQCGQCAAAPPASQSEQEAEPLQRKELNEQTPHASPETANRIAALRGGGHALPSSLRNFFEPRFGRDFGEVRIHTDASAAETAGAVDARAFTLGPDVVFGAGQYQPDTAAGRHLLAHELAHVVQQSSGAPGQAAPQLMRAKCGHDGRESGCGVNYGFLKFPDENWIIDRNLVRLMGVAFGGKWIAELPTPANPVKSGKDSGRADGVKVSDSGALTLEIVEVKSRVVGDKTKPTGGCEKATSEAKGYVSVLEKIAPKVQTLSEKIAAKYPNHGFRLDGHDKPQGKVEREIFVGLGIDIDNEEWLQAWTVYNYIQRNWPKVFTKAFSSVKVKLNADGNTAVPYDALDYPIDCSKKGGKKSAGKGTLSFMVNKEGGVSYGCEESCEEEEDKRKPQVKQLPKDVQQPQDKNKPGIKDIDPTFNYIFRDGKVNPLPDSLPELPPGQFFIVAVTKLLYDAVKGAEQIQNFLKMVQIPVPDWLKRMNTEMLILLTAEVAGFVAAGGIIAAELALAGAATAAAVTTTAAATTTTTATATTTLMLSALGTVAANDNALAIAAAAAAFILALNQNSSSEADAKKVAEAALSNKKVLAAQEATQYPELQQVGAEMKVGANAYRVIIVAKS